MATKEIAAYYDVTEHRSVRSDLVFALEMLTDKGVAIDCGCGAGSDIAFLRDNGFIVHAFDSEAEAVRRCSNRFKHDENVFVSLDSFSSFTYPRASLVVADASLFFCPAWEFEAVWLKITNFLEIGGIFSGSFLGPNDTIASAAYDKDAYWKDVSVFTEPEIRKKFSRYDILKWTEHEVSGKTPQDVPHDWHIFSVVAKKRN